MDENEDDMAARVERLEDQVHNLKQLVRRLNQKLALETQPVGLAKMRGLGPVETEPGTEAEQRFIGLMEEAEIETVEEVEFDFEEELPLSETVEEEFTVDAVEERLFPEEEDED